MDMACMPILQAGVYRFDASATAKSQAAPSLSFADPKLREVPFFGGDSSSLTKDPTFVPEFVSKNGQQIVLFKLPSGTSFYGTGEVGGALERTGKRIFTWNTDAWGYNENTTSLYQSHPWVFAILPNGEAFGVLADTSCRCEVDLRKNSTIRFAAVLSFPVLTFGPFPSPESLSTALGYAIGTIPLPPKWALGYHQCRWSYEPAARVVEVSMSSFGSNMIFVAYVKVAGGFWLLISVPSTASLLVFS
jgi:alpha-glucosidase (family GH31 glycosyl hydrolase)